MPRVAEKKLAFSTLAVGGELLGMTTQGFQKLADQDDFPKKQDGQWKASEVVAWYLQSKLDSPAYDEARARKMAADATKAELDVASRRRELLVASDVERKLATGVAKHDEIVNKSFHSLAPKLSGLDAPAILLSLQKWWRGIRKNTSLQ